LRRGHVPLRTCRGCSGRFPRGSLLRFTLGPEGVVAGDGPGRGYYVCRDPGCLGKVLSRRNLSRLFGRPLSEEDTVRVNEALLEKMEDSGRPERFPSSENRR
jgi:predicted RNA-binding protein YlxR (DUF448 family)